MVNPKLALIPSGVKAGKVYSVLPSNGTGDFPFDRNQNTATRVNKDGLIEMVDADVPRLNYPTNEDCPSLLLEPSIQNYIVGSNHFQDWATGGTVERNADFGISPDGTQNSVNVNLDNFGIIYRSPNRPQSDYTFSVFAKKVDGTDNLLALRLDTPTAKIGIFNLDTGFKVVNTSDEASIEYYGNGWYRCSITVYDNEVINAVIGEGQNGLNCELYGAMLEEGTYPTSYIETPQNSIASRSYDNVVNFQPDYWQNQGGIPYIDAYGVSSVPDMFNGLEGVLFLEMKPSALDGVKKIITLSSGYLTDRIIIGYNTNNTFIASVYNNGVWQSVLGGQTQFIGNRSISEFNKIAISYKQNEFKLFVNGTKEREDTSGTVFNADTLKILRFSGVGADNPFRGEIRQMQYFGSSLTDQELINLTKI